MTTFSKIVRNRLCAILCSIVVFPGNFLAQSPEEASISDSVKTFLIPQNLSHFLGLGVGIVERGRPDFTYSYGYQDASLNKAFTDSTIFNLGSVSKLFTAMSVLKLHEQKLVNLDDPVFKYFPEFLRIQGKANRFAAAITLRDLLQHRSGITQSMEDLYPELFDKGSLKSEAEYYENTFNYRAFMSQEDFKNRFLMYGRMGQRPQKKYQFSNLGYVLLGYIVEQVARVNLGQFVTDEFLEPLGMTDSHYYLSPDSMVSRLAKGYYRLGDGSYLNVHENEIESPSPTGDGGLKTSVRDMQKFMHFLIGNPSKDLVWNKILSRSMLLSMTAPMEKGPDKTTWIGLGFHNLQPFNFTGHAGGWDGYLAILYYHPESQSCFFIVTNREDNHLFMFLTVYSAYALLHRKF